MRHQSTPTPQMNTTIPLGVIGTSCPWRIVAPAAMSKLARDLEAARTRPWMRESLTRRAETASQHAA